MFACSQPIVHKLICRITLGELLLLLGPRMSVPRVYSWDKPEHGGSASSSQPVQERQGMHEEGDGIGWVSDDSSDTEDVQDPEEATQQFLEYLLWSKQRGHMSAKQICTVAFWASKAGATGMQVLAVDPRSSGDNHQKKVDAFVGKTRGPDVGMTYVVCVPAYVPSEGSRQLWDLHTMPPHEVLSTCDVGEREAMVSEFCKAKADNQLPPAYWRHPVVAMAGPDEVVLPLSIFMDGVRYGKKGSILGITVRSILPGGRSYLCAALRKRIACVCGCSRWCTLWPVFKMLHWSLRALAKGEWPARNHMDQSWADVGDSKRQELGGTKLPFRGALLQLRCDWSELAHTLGFPSWSSSTQPCLLCSIKKSEMQQSIQKQLPLDPFAWPLKSWEAYCEACSSCEFELVSPSKPVMSYMRKLLHPDHRKDGSQGLALRAPLPNTVLAQGDRVEPMDGGVWDWQQIFAEDSPTHVCFWRPRKQTMAKHRNPLFDSEIGTDVWNTVAVDCMHTWFLGIFQQYLAALLWAMLAANLSSSTSPTAENRNQENMAKLNRTLQKFYRDTEHSDPEIKFSKMELKMEVLGKQKSNLLSVKAAETLGLLHFMVTFLPTVRSSMVRSASVVSGRQFIVEVVANLQGATLGQHCGQHPHFCQHLCQHPRQHFSGIPIFGVLYQVAGISTRAFSGTFSPPPIRFAPPHITALMSGLEKGGLLEKGSFQKSQFSRDSREFRSKILENPQTLENKGESDHFLEILDFRHFRDSRDSSSEKTPFVMTPFSGLDDISKEAPIGNKEAPRNSSKQRSTVNLWGR